MMTSCPWGQTSFSVCFAFTMIQTLLLLELVEKPDHQIHQAVEHLRIVLLGEADHEPVRRRRRRHRVVDQLALGPLHPSVTFRE